MRNFLYIQYAKDYLKDVIIHSLYTLLLYSQLMAAVYKEEIKYQRLVSENL